MVNPIILWELLQQIRPRKLKQGLQRVGPNGDGGYLIPKEELDVSDVFSPGVANVCDFELHFARQGVQCHLCDSTVEGPPVEHPNLRFTRKHIGQHSEGQFVSLSDWIGSSPTGDGDWILQMDIEGSEYVSLLSTDERVLNRFSVVVVEFHAFDRILSEEFFPLISSTIIKMSRLFTPVHAHANNATDAVNVMGKSIPTCFEMTYFKVHDSELDGFSDSIPHPLDARNIATKPDVSFDPNWYR
jgi:hypothetical protein